MAIESADHSESRLPDDLQFIGEQLWEDADHLVRTYPANAPRNWRRAFAAAVAQRAEGAAATRLVRAEDPQRRGVLSDHVKVRPAAFGGVVAAAVMGVVAIGWYSANLQQFNEPNGGRVTVQDSHPEPQVDRVITAEAELFPGMGSPWWGANTISQPKVVLPAGAETFDYFSPPEQEAILDVWTKLRIREGNVRY